MVMMMMMIMMIMMMVVVMVMMVVMMMITVLMVDQCTHMSGNNAISCEKFTDAPTSHSCTFSIIKIARNPLENLQFGTSEESLRNSWNLLKSFGIYCIVIMNPLNLKKYVEIVWNHLREGY